MSGANLRIVAAANRKDGIVYTGVHHHLILWQISCCGGGKGGEQGFMASDGRFVDRVEAKKIAREAGQLVNELSHKPNELFSEELWNWKKWCTSRGIPA